tara:strand:- start:53 stop:598 length:546 start_codon:yes stop_codon:yes gene_type:complete
MADGEASLDRVSGSDGAMRVHEAQAADRAQNAPAARMTPQSATHLAAQIARKYSAGNRQFDIRMDPPDLGKVDVRLHVSNDNRVHAILTAERSETLAELQRNARDLERALADAGLELGDQGLEFQLSQGDSERSFGDSTPDSIDVYADSEMGGEIVAPDTGAPRHMYGFSLTQRSGVDVQV